MIWANSFEQPTKNTSTFGKILGDNLFPENLEVAVTFMLENGSLSKTIYLLVMTLRRSSFVLLLRTW